MAADHAGLVNYLEQIAEMVPEDISTDASLRLRLLQAIAKLSPKLQTPAPLPLKADDQPPILNGAHTARNELSNIGAQTTPRLILTAEDINGLQRACFDWADSYDHKDWTRLANNVTDPIDLDYTSLGLPHWPKMSAAEYIAMTSSHNFIGNPAIDCQHLLGCGYFTLTGPDEAEGRHQIRAAHQVYTDSTRTEVKLKGHAHSSNIHKYKKVDGHWKLSGLKPAVLWGEYDFDDV